ncbi:MAG: ABC transporter ATP-binding protein [Clostridia bacterium]|nr:ABC transporter ATP-binding protein [Clostridia bacterium]
MVLRCEQLEKVYNAGTATEVRALPPTDMAIERGKFYSVIGRSGAGKSTLLHLLGALDRPTSGKLYIDGESVYDMSDRELADFRSRRIGFVFQAYNLLPEHTAGENITMPSDMAGRHPDAAYLDEVIAALGLEDKLLSYPDELSGGEQQRVAIARALVGKPAIILADEPTGNLDPKTGDEVLLLMKKLAHRFDQTIIVVTHDMEIAALADEVVRLDATAAL